MKYPLPIEIVKGRYPIVTQEFGDPAKAAWYKANGIDIDSHNGTDIVISGGEINTYGTKLVCPVPKSMRTSVWYESPMSTKGNGVKIMWKEGKDTVEALCWHCSECKQRDSYELGDTLGYIGNSGLVTPKPSFYRVHAGAHLHLGTWINGVLVDPRTVFDFKKWFTSEVDTGIEKDLPPFQYFINKMWDIIRSISPKVRT